MNEENNINNQENNDLEKTQIMSVTEPTQNIVSPAEPTKTEEPVTGISAANAPVEVQNISTPETTTKEEESIQNVVENPDVEVKEEEKVEEVKVKEEVTYKDPSKFATILTILLFVGLFIFIIEMPRINEWLDNRKQDQELNEIEKQAKLVEEENKRKEEEKKKAAEEAKKKQEEEENSTITLTCKLNVAATDTVTYAKTVTETFDYNKKTNNVTVSSITTKYTFTTQDATYTSLKNKCQTDANKYIGKEGYSVSCTSDDLSVTMGSEFDLATYKTITDGNTKITPNATLNENIATVKGRLTTAGYTCE